MDEATQSRIFEPFFTTKEGGQRTGLGLATADADSARNFNPAFMQLGNAIGTTFQVFFPALEQAAIAIEDAQQKTPPAQRGQETILIAEEHLKRKPMNAYEGLSHTQ